MSLMEREQRPPVVPPRPLPGLADLLPGQRIEIEGAQVLFADLRNSSMITDLLGHGAMDRLLHRFHTLGARAVIGRGGKVYDFPNDAILAVFHGDAGPRPPLAVAEQIIDLVGGDIAAMLREQSGDMISVAVGVGLDRGTLQARREAHGDVDKISLTGSCANAAAALTKVAPSTVTMSSAPLSTYLQPGSHTVATVSFCAPLGAIPDGWRQETINIGAMPRQVLLAGVRPHSDLPAL